VRSYIIGVNWRVRVMQRMGHSSFVTIVTLSSFSHTSTSEWGQFRSPELIPCRTLNTTYPSTLLGQEGD